MEGRRERPPGIFLPLAAIFCAALVAPGAPRAARENAAALGYLSGRLAGGGASPAGDHPRGDYWQAVEAVRAADWATVVVLAAPGAAAGDHQMAGLLGYAYLQLGEYGAAVAPWARARNAEGLAALAEEALAAGRPEAAEAAYRAAWEIDPRISASRLAGLLVDLGRPGEAVDLLRVSIEAVGAFERDLPYWYRSLARILMEEDRWAEAVEAWQGVIVNANLFYPGAEEDGATYLGLARSLFMTGRYAEAREAIEESFTHGMDQDGLLLAAQIYLALGDQPAALDAYRAVLAEDPENAEALEAVGEIEGG